ncbi:MAG: hemolysin family protein [Chloroflexota bacterium]|nr:hemolysin family protein [Chloroflexota bacterium]
MSGVDTIYLIVGLLCILLSAFFASAEIAYINLERIRIKHLQESGRPGAERVASIMEHPEKFLSVVLTCISVTETIAVALGGFLFLSLLGEGLLGTVVGIVVMAIILLLFVKVIPKTIAAQHPEEIALRYAPAIDITSKLVSPIVVILSKITGIIARPTGLHTIPGALLSKEELRTAISIGHDGGVFDETSAKMLNRMVKFGDLSVREVMTPRTDVIWVQEGATLEDFQRIYSGAPRYRYPIYEVDYDNVKGVLLSRDVHVALDKGEFQKDSIVTGLTRPVTFVPGTKPVGELFNEMRDRGVMTAVVLSEYGGTSGIVTIEQLIKEIVGEISEEVVGTPKEFEIIGEHTYQIEGCMRIDVANEELSLGIPEGNKYETIGGFIFHLLGHLPEVGEEVTYKNLKWMVTSVGGKRIERVIVTKIEELKEETLKSNESPVSEEDKEFK